MKKEQYNPDEEFANRIKDALESYGLEEGDLGKQVGTNATDIKKIMNLERTVGLKRADRIAAVFGMRYFEFGNPSVEFLPKEKLPRRTVEAINERLLKGPSDIEINTELDLPLQTMKVLSNYSATSEFTPNDIHDQLPADVKSQIGPNRITVLFKVGSLKKYVEFTNKKENKRHVFTFISEETKKDLDAAIKALSN